MLEGGVIEKHASVNFPGGRGSFRSETQMVPEPYVDFRFHCQSLSLLSAHVYYPYVYTSLAHAHPRHNDIYS